MTTPQAGAELPLIDRLEAHARNADYTSSSMLCFEAADALRLAAPAQDREAIARIICDGMSNGNIQIEDAGEPLRGYCLTTADAILALNVGGRAAAEPVAWRYRVVNVKGERLSGWRFSEEPSALGLYEPLYAAPLPQALERWYRAYHHGTKEDEALQAELLAKAVNLDAALSLPAQGEADGLCELCSKPTESMSGNPALWPILLSAPDGTGIARFHHAGCVSNRVYIAATPDTAPDGVREWLALLEDQCWDIRCVNIPTGGDDYDVGWRVIEHHMAEPNERIIGYGLSPVEALLDASTPKDDEDE